MRLRAKTLVYVQGHFVAEGQEFDAPEDKASALVASNIAEVISGGKGMARTAAIDLSDAPNPVANLRPPARKPKPKGE